MRKKRTSCFLAGAMAAILFGVSMNAAFYVRAEERGEEMVKLNRVMVHDPSIVKDEKSGEYYVFGSHMADAKSSDMTEWIQMDEDYANNSNTGVYGDVRTNFAESFRWAGAQGDADNTQDHPGVWAPDVFWNKDYKWEDGTKGAYMMYYSASSSWCRSCIGYAVSKEIEGTYEYVDTIIYTGFNKNGGVDNGLNGGTSTIDIKWDNEYLNLKELTDLGASNGGIDGISEKWFTSSGAWNEKYAPNAIDPTIFYSADQSKLYMVYGSWSGGLFVQELDKETGAVKYSGVDKKDAVSGNFVDRYFGVHIAGSDHQSGEGAFIDYDEESGYYYLYETYGGLTATGGYNMRLFRSKNPTGPYVDASGKNAADISSSQPNEEFGIKVMGNYQFYNQPAYMAAGHNSFFKDEDGQRYLIYHQRFGSDTCGHIFHEFYHEMRVHQQFLNEDDWPVTAVYENRGEKIAHYDDSEVVGTYEMINHGKSSDGTMLETKNIELNADGTVSGAVSGSWKKSTAKDYDYVTIELGETVYKGVFFKQYNEAVKPEQTMTFTAIGNNNETIWGSKIEVNDELVVDRAIAQLDGMIPETASEEITLPDKVLEATVTWTSENESILSADGVVNAVEEDTNVVLTANVSYGTIQKSKEYSIKIYGIPKLIYGFDFETAMDENMLMPDDGSGKTGTAKLMGDAVIENDSERGNVLHLTNLPNAKGVTYLQLPEDTLTTVTSAGYTVSMWTKIGESTFEHSALFEADRENTYPMTRMGANLITRINANGYSDVQGELLKSSGTTDVWQHLIYTVNPSGIKVYLNGELIGQEKKNLAGCFDTENAASIQKATNVKVGSGFIWNDEDVRDAMFDEIKVFDGAVTEKQAENLYQFGKLQKAEPENPPIEPENPPTEPENPPIEPENPPTEPENPPTEPENPSTEPENPSTEPENPPTKPERKVVKTALAELENVIAQAEEGTIIQTVSDENGSLTAKAQSQIVGKDISIEIKLENGIIWKLNGKNLNAGEKKEIPLKVVLCGNSIPEKTKNSVSESIYQMEMELAHDGDFGGTFGLALPTGEAYQKYYGNLFYYNEQTQKLEYVSSKLADADGMMQFDFTHASKYVIYYSEKPMSQASVKTISENIENKASEQPTDTVTAVKTGDDARPEFYILLCIFASMIPIGVWRKKY